MATYFLDTKEEKFFSGKASQVLFACLSRALLADNPTPVGSANIIYIISL